MFKKLDFNRVILIIVSVIIFLIVMISLISRSVGPLDNLFPLNSQNVVDTSQQGPTSEDIRKEFINPDNPLIKVDKTYTLPASYSSQ